MKQTQTHAARHVANWDLKRTRAPIRVVERLTQLAPRFRKSMPSPSAANFGSQANAGKVEEAGHHVGGRSLRNKITRPFGIEKGNCGGLHSDWAPS